MKIMKKKLWPRLGAICLFTQLGLVAQGECQLNVDSDFERLDEKGNLSYWKTVGLRDWFELTSDSMLYDSTGGYRGAEALIDYLATDEEVVIVDDVLRQEIKKMLSIDPNQPIYRMDMLNLFSLNLV